MSNTATRLINLILLLQRRPNQKAADLARELGISVRSLHRYFAMLDEMGIPVYSERGPYGGFSLVRGYRMPPLVFTPEESVAVYLGVGMVEEMWGKLYRDAARGALAKLENVLPDEQRHEVAWARRSLFATGLHRADFDVLAPLLEKLRRAAREHRRAHLCYQSLGHPEPVCREIDPYALLHRWGWWYAVGYCHLRRAVRTFRIDRISELRLLESTFDPPDAFDLRTYLQAEFHSQPQVTVCLRFFPDMAHAALENRVYWETLEPQPDGAILVTFQSPSLEWAASTALAYGPAVEALSPPELRTLIAQWAAAVTDRYQNDE